MTDAQTFVLDSLATAGDALAALRPDTAEVVRPVTVWKNGGETSTETTIATSGCRRRVLTGRELAVAEKVANSATWKLVLDPVTDVTVSDAIVVSGKRYEVQWVQESSLRTETTCYCSEVSS